MTVAATSTFELSRDALIRRSFQIAGLLEASQRPSADDYSLASDLLVMVLHSLQSEGITITQTSRTTQALVASTAEYALAAEVLDVFVDGNNIAGTVYPSTGVETPVRAISRSEYNQIPTKTTSGTPSLVLIERLSTVSLLFWPAPSATMTFRYLKERFPRDLDEGTQTLDISRRWLLPLTYMLAHQVAFAKSLPLDRRRELKGEAEELKRAAKNSDVEKGAMQLYVGRYS